MARPGRLELHCGLVLAHSNCSEIELKLKPSEWWAGDRCRIVDLVAPSAKAQPFLQALKDGPLAEKEVRLLKLDPETRKLEVVVVEET